MWGVLPDICLTNGVTKQTKKADSSGRFPRVQETNASNIGGQKRSTKCANVQTETQSPRVVKVHSPGTDLCASAAPLSLSLSSGSSAARARNRVTTDERAPAAFCVHFYADVVLPSSNKAALLATATATVLRCIFVLACFCVGRLFYFSSFPFRGLAHREKRPVPSVVAKWETSIRNQSDKE